MSDPYGGDVPPSGLPVDRAESGDGANTRPPDRFSGRADPMSPKPKGRPIAWIVVGVLGALATGGGIAVLAINVDNDAEPDIDDIVQCIQESPHTDIVSKMRCAELVDAVVVPGNAQVGQCLNIEDDDGLVFLYKRDCNEEHDAEIVGVAEVTEENLAEIESAMVAYCLETINETDQAKVDAHIQDLDAVIEDPSNIAVGDTFVCYVHPTETLNKPLR